MKGKKGGISKWRAGSVLVLGALPALLAPASGCRATPSGAAPNAGPDTLIRCIPGTCVQHGATCGPVADGCGGVLNCGTCTGQEKCGGGGQPSVCGTSADGGVCVPRTCAAQDISCGPAGDGCGGLISCGSCTAPETCGGGGEPSVCGGGSSPADAATDATTDAATDAKVTAKTDAAADAGTSTAKDASADARSIADAQSEASTSTSDASSTTPLPSYTASSDGHYLVDPSGKPFRVHGDTSWDAPININLADLRFYLDDRKAKGFNAVFTYIANPVVYYVGSSAPWAVQLGGRSAGAAALPFTQNISGGTWDGDPGFTHHDASFASPNDAYHAWIAQFVDEAASRGMVVLLAPMYLGYNLGASDGWYSTLMNSGNTRAVCNAYGQYLANGHGTFTGFKGRPNIIWVEGGDTLPGNGSEGALRALEVVKGLVAAGDSHLHTAHWQHDYLTPDQTDFLPYLGAWGAYSHGFYPSPGATYANARVLYGEATPRPTFLLETSYWGDHGATRAQVREFWWASGLSTIGGTTFGFGALWGFVVSPDGSTGFSTAWVPNTGYSLNQYASKAGAWYRVTQGGTTGTTGPTGTSTAIVDGTVTWTYVGTGSWKALLSEPGVIDFQQMGSFLNGIPWFRLVPSGLNGMATLITAGTGTYASWSDMNSPQGGMDWVVSAAASDGSLLVAYVPDAHSGALTVAMSALHGSARARWYDPVNATYTADPSGTGFTLANSGTHDFNVPGKNSGGDGDWVLLLDTAAAGLP
jgi:hypothetical protein